MDPHPPTEPDPIRPDLEPADDTDAEGGQISLLKKKRTALMVVAAVVVALSATGAAAVRFMAGSDAKLLERVPATADVAFTVYLDPAAGQKMNLVRMVTAFPDAGSEQELRGQLNDVLDEALAQAGLTHEDLDWVGSQVVGFLDFEQGVDEPQGAVLVAVDDEEGARTAIDALVETSKDRGESITIEDHDGVEVIVNGQEGGGAVALAGGVMILASGGDIIDDVIGAEAGDSLAASPMFTETVAELPEDHLAMAYVNVPGLLESLEEQIAAAEEQMTPARVAGIAGFSGSGPLNDAGIEGAAVSLSAEPDGFAIDAFASVDASKLSDEQRAALGSDHVNALIDLVSADALGFGAQTGYDVQIRQGLEDLAAADPTMSTELERLGITGPGGLASILGPDLAFEVTPGTTLPVGGAVMVSTTDPAAMRVLMDRWARQLGEQLPGGGKWVEAEHSGVSYTYLDGPAELPVAYGVVDDVAVIAVSPDELTKIIERSQGGRGSIGEDATYTQAAVRVPTDDAVFFLNVDDIVAEISKQLGAQVETELDAVEPIATFTIGSSSDLEGMRGRVFVEIP
ncbi:MAG: DUF3352 domain-containing protein [Actinomycetota bacterium]